MSGKPTLEVTTDVNGSPTVRLTGKGFVLTEEEAESIVKLVADLRKLCAELHMNLRNREAVMELMGIPPSKEQRDVDEIIEQRMDELGIPRGQ